LGSGRGDRRERGERTEERMTKERGERGVGRLKKRGEERCVVR
jgi:hypothetical protein